MVRTTTDGRYYYLTPTTLVRLHHHGVGSVWCSCVPALRLNHPCGGGGIPTPNRRTPKYCKNKRRKQWTVEESKITLNSDSACLHKNKVRGEMILAY